jgi:uncharacterized protein (DUF1697 family)
MSVTPTLSALRAQFARSRRNEQFPADVLVLPPEEWRAGIRGPDGKDRQMAGTRFIALLKGVNVGRANRIAMADLRTMLGDLGYQDVATHLQSGNAVFTASESASKVGDAVEAGLRKLGVKAPVVIRTHEQLSGAVAADPYAEIADDPAKHLLGFFSARPKKESLAAFEEMVSRKSADPAVTGLHQITGDHCYLWCPQGVLKSLFGTVDWDGKLGVAVTMRNFKTVGKLLDMSAP